MSDLCPLITRRCNVLVGKAPTRSGLTSRPAGCCHCRGLASEACTQETPRRAWQWAGACLSCHVGRHPLSTECESCLKVPLDFSQILILSPREWAESPPLHTLPPHLTAAVAPVCAQRGAAVRKVGLPANLLQWGWAVCGWAGRRRVSAELLR